MILELLAFLAACALTALCSGSETAYSAASRIRALGRARERKPWARLATRFMSRPEAYLTTTLVGTNVGLVLGSSITARIAADLTGSWAEPVFAIGTAVFILIFAEVLPKHLAFEWRDSLVDPLAPVLAVLRIALFPIVFLAGAVPRLIVRNTANLRFFESREEVRAFLTGEGEEAGRSADKVLQLGSAPAADHMRPVEGYPSVVLTQPREEVLAAALECDSHVLLVFEPDRRTLLGAVKTATIVRHRGDWDLARLTEGLPYFQRREVLGQVLQRLRRAGAHAGVVIGRTGQPEGIIDSRSIVDAVLGMGGQSCPTRNGRLEWRDGRSVFARSVRDVG